ncbi:MAG: T9SS type A sorting domain-containing protein [Chloroherpetonaceae bacterium]|nr:T9SS type A sorting domain-containing protein [Chloroherpetonaceae bacterium]
MLSHFALLLLLLSSRGMAQRRAIDHIGNSNKSFYESFLDLSFGNNGVGYHQFGNNDRFYAVAVQADGKIVAVGETITGSFSSNLIVGRFLSNGEFDNSFGTGGKVFFNFGEQDIARDILIDIDGKILIAGKMNDKFGVLRLKPDGTLDSSFGSNGAVILNQSDLTHEARSMAIQPDGKIVVAGGTPTFLNEIFCVVRLTSKGDLDETFSSDGRAVYGFGGFDDVARKVLVHQVEGQLKITVIGSSTINGNADYAVVRFKEDGTLDESLAGTGALRFPFENGNEFGRSAVILENGDLIIVGDVLSTTASRIGMMRLKPNGELNENFGNSGRKFLENNTNWSNFYPQKLRRNGNKLMIGGHVSGSFGLDWFLYQINEDGNLDESFGNSGVITTNFGASEYANDFLVQTDKKIIQVGHNSTRTMIARYSVSPLRTPSNENEINGFELVQNYPNPFNPSTTISYRLSKAAPVSLKVFDALGREVATLTNGFKQAGTHQVQFDASKRGLSSGAYFYRLQVENRTLSKKMVLTK